MEEYWAISSVTGNTPVFSYYSVSCNNNLKFLYTYKER